MASWSNIILNRLHATLMDSRQDRGILLGATVAREKARANASS